MPGGCYGFQHEKRFVALQLSVPGPVFNATSDRAPAIFLSFLGCAILSDERIRNLVADVHDFLNHGWCTHHPKK